MASLTAVTPVQKTSLESRPAWAVPGTVKLRLRSTVSAQVNGCVHCRLAFGPSGPSLNDRSRCPQWPWKLIQASFEVGGARVGTTIARGLTVVEGPVESSQPSPSLALRPSQSALRK